MTVTHRIETNPKVMMGKPVIRGTRIPVELILRKLSEGASVDDLLDAYPRLTREDIRAVVQSDKSSRQTSMRSRKTPARPTMIKQMVAKIVERFQPEKVILFGSHAREDAGPDSDVDLLVVMPVSKKRDAVLKIRAALRGFRVPKDIVVTTPSDFAWRKDVVGTIEYPAVHEGKVLYART
jgi:uncharacterized protein